MKRNLKRELIIGVDPGLTGAIALIDPANDKLLQLIDMPAIKRGSRSDIDLERLASEFECLIDVEMVSHAVIEDTAARPGQGVVSMFTFGRVTGIVVGLIAAHHIKIHFVKPEVWKLATGLNKDKSLSRTKAQKLFPLQADKFSLKKHDGRAEAALLAHFGRRFGL